MRHGRAIMPWGAYKGIQVRLLPDDYLSWLATSAVIIAGEQWTWLRESIFAELRFRGLCTNGVEKEVFEARKECQVAVPPYWNTRDQCTSETCHRPLPCPIHTEEKAQSDFEFEETKFLLGGKRTIHLEKP